MSDKIPSFEYLDAVRVMQTDEMVSRGLANKIGLIASQGPGDFYTVCDPLDPMSCLSIPAHSLMKASDADLVRCIKKRHGEHVGKT